MESRVTLTQGMAFTVEADGHTFTIDAAPEHGGQNSGARPKTLALASLAGCGAMDVISILRKMRQDVTRFSVHASSPLADTHPKVFTDMVVTYEIDGAVEAAKAWKAIGMSRDTYCGVAAMLKKHGPIRYRLVLNGAEVPETT